MAAFLRFLGDETGAVKIDYALVIGSMGFLFVKAASAAAGFSVADGGDV
jgi:Flp pilus assembly pilin Flp